jgi:hypothetical protein
MVNHEHGKSCDISMTSAVMCMGNWEQCSVTGAGFRWKCYVFKWSAQTGGRTWNDWCHNTGAGTRVWFCKLLLCTQSRHRTNTCGGSSGGPPVLPSTNLNNKSRMNRGRPRIHETSGGTGHNHAKRRHLTGRQVCRKETVCIFFLTITLDD